MTLDEFNTIAWRDFILFAYCEESLRKAFAEATGIRFLPSPKNALEAMIDQATNAGDETLRAFVRWVTETQWGIEYAPEAYRAEICEARA